MDDIALMREINRLQGQIDALRTIQQGWSPVFLATPLTSTSWDGDARSTTGKTKIDLSAVFGTPAGIKAILIGVSVRDSASASVQSYMYFGPTSTNGEGLVAKAGEINDRRTEYTLVVPCDGNGDIYYQIQASGTNTFDAWIDIWGYWI